MNKKTAKITKDSARPVYNTSREDERRRRQEAKQVQIGSPAGLPEYEYDRP